MPTVSNGDSIPRADLTRNPSRLGLTGFVALWITRKSSVTTLAIFAILVLILLRMGMASSIAGDLLYQHS